MYITAMATGTLQRVHVAQTYSTGMHNEHVTCKHVPCSAPSPGLDHVLQTLPIKLHSTALYTVAAVCNALASSSVVC